MNKISSIYCSEQQVCLAKTFCPEQLHCFTNAMTASDPTTNKLPGVIDWCVAAATSKKSD
jgi:hypothetical protein